MTTTHPDDKFQPHHEDADLTGAPIPDANPVIVLDDIDTSRPPE